MGKVRSYSYCKQLSGYFNCRNHKRSILSSTQRCNDTQEREEPNLIDQVLFGKIVDEALQVLGVVRQRVVVVEAVDLEVAQLDVLVDVNA